jgi:predicted RNA-binding Zn-ribbon protein involved in translation (DUF1610 family)
MSDSATTPADSPHTCLMCRAESLHPPEERTFDAPCPNCGFVIWFERSDGQVIPFEREMNKAGVIDDPAAWEELHRHGTLVFDFRRIKHFQSQVLGRMIRVKQKLGKQARLKVLIHRDLMEVFRITRLDQIFHLEADG